MLMENDSVQPGQTVTPSSAPAPAAPSEPPASAAPTPDPAPAPDPKPDPTPSPAPEPAAPEPPAGEPGQENPAPDDAQAFDNSLPDTGDEGTADAPDTQPISWTASEFIAHAKSASWYGALALAAAVGAALIYLLTRDPVSAAVIIVAAVVLAIYAGHQPRELEYRIDFKGLTVGQKHFGYDQFRSFSVLPEGSFSSIVFMPLKRFAVPTTIYYAPEDEPKIVQMLSDYLPLDQEHGHDAIDRLMHRIRF